MCRFPSAAPRRRGARQYCGALGKRANCQVAVSVHAATDTASCPLEWELFLPEEWTGDHDRRRSAGIPDEVGHASKTRLALGLLDRLAGQGLAVPVLVADAGYGRSVTFRLALEERGWSYLMAVDPKEIARPADPEPHHRAYGGLGPPTCPRYRDKPRPLPGLIDDATVFQEVTWRQGSKGTMTSQFAVLQVRPSGKGACRTTQEKAGGRSRWNGALVRTGAPVRLGVAGRLTGICSTIELCGEGTLPLTDLGIHRVGTNPPRTDAEPPEACASTR